MNLYFHFLTRETRLRKFYRYEEMLIGYFQISTFCIYPKLFLLLINKEELLKRMKLEKTLRK